MGISTARRRPPGVLGRLVALALVIGSLVLVGQSAVADVGTRAASAGPAAATGAAAASGRPVAFGGGDVETLTRPAAMFSASPGAPGTWIAVPVPAAVPRVAAGAVVLQITTAASTTEGQVAIRATGTTGGVLLDLGTRPTTTTTVVRLGRSGLQVSATTADAPAVTVVAVGWIPKTSSFTTPSSPVVLSPVTATDQAAAVQVTGVAGIPSTATSVLLQVRTTGARRAGALAMWTPGSPRPTRGDQFPARTPHSWLATATPPPDGLISIAALTGSATVSVQVLGWAEGAVTVAAGAGETWLPDVAPGAARQVALAGVGPVPATGLDAGVLAVSAPAGSRVRIWGTGPTSAAPQVAFTSSGGVVSVLVPIGAGGAVTMSTTGSAPTRVGVTGWTAQPADLAVSFVPRSGTTLLGPTDVVATQSGVITVDRAAAPTPVGGHVLVRSGGGAPYLARVTAVATAPGGQQRLSLVGADIADAFDDYDVSYPGDDAPAARGTSASAPASSLASPLPLGLDAWECEGGVHDVALDTDLTFEGRPSLDLDLSERLFDFTLKGALVATVAVAGELDVTCELDTTRPVATVPLGATGLALKLGVEGSADLHTEGEISFTNTSRVYTNLFYNGGEPVREATVGNHSDVTTAGRSTASLDLGLSAAVGTLQPPGTEDVITAEVAATVGVRFAIDRPALHPETGGTYVGPSCSDLTATPYLDLGASVVLPFFPDVQLSLADAELPSVVLFKGPCVGFTGTITYEERRGGFFQCPGPNCGGSLVSNRATMTFINGPLVVGRLAEDFYQPYRWTGSSAATSIGYCTEDSTAGGSGRVGGFTDTQWPHANLYWPATTAPQPQPTVDVGTWGGPQVFGTTTTRCPDHEASTRAWTTTPWPVAFPMPVPPAYLRAGLTGLPRVRLSGTYVRYADSDDDDDLPDWTTKYTINLTRQEYPRT